MKKISLVLVSICVIISSCKKEKNFEPNINTTTVNYYDTVNTGKSFIECYITNTDGNTQIFVNNVLVSNTSGSAVKVFNTINLDTVKVICTKPITGYIQIDIRKNYTYVRKTNINDILFVTTYIVN